MVFHHAISITIETIRKKRQMIRMGKKMRLVGFVIVMFMLSLVFFQCSEDKKATVMLYLTDAPAVYDEVNVDIQQVFIKLNDSTEEEISLERTGVYNLLNFRDGLDTLLGSIELPAGKISQVRLVLGDSNSVVVDGETHELKVPSGSASGLKLNFHQELEEGLNFKLWLDFDASRSVIAKGNGQYSLKPVIRMFGEATTGAIKGTVSPASALPFVWAVIGTDTLGTIANEEGLFLIKGVAEGTYSVTLQPQNGMDPVALSNVTVTKGETTNVGTVEFGVAAE